MKRLEQLDLQLKGIKGGGEGTIEITDNRTGKKYEVPTKTSRECDFFDAKDLLKIKDA